MKKLSILAFLIFAIAPLFADEQSAIKKPNPPLLVVDKKQKKVVKKSEVRQSPNGWHFVGGVYSSFGLNDPGDDEREFLCFPLISARYRHEVFEFGTEGLGVGAKRYFWEDAAEAGVGVEFGFKRNGKKSADGYMPSVLNDVKFKVGAGAFFFRADYTYLPIKVSHPPKKSESLDAHFVQLSLETPGFPLMVKPIFWGIKGSASLQIMDDNYASAYFNYYDKNGQATYSAKGGLYSFIYSVSSNLFVGKRWMLMFDFKREFFLDDARRSPVVKKTAANSFTSMIMYSF